MEIERFQAWFEADGARLVEVVRPLSPAVPVPTCPGWTVRDLVVHTAQVYEHKLAAIALAGERPDGRSQAPAGRDPVDWLADAHARLLATLRSTPPDAPSWTWWPADQTVGFWSRRMAHETAVHRVDAEAAAGRAGPLDAALAEDGVAEVLDTMLGGDWSTEPQAGSVGTVRVSTGRRAWRVTMMPERVDVDVDAAGSDAGAAGVDVEITAGASDLDLWLWGRVADGAVRVTGDAGPAERFRARLALATQ